MNSNITFSEQLRINPTDVLNNPLLLEELIETLRRFEEVGRQLSCYRNMEIEELESYIEKLEANQENEDHKDYDDYKNFFDDCYNALDKVWPCAAPWSTEFVDVICRYIRIGERVDNEIIEMFK